MPPKASRKVYENTKTTRENAGFYTTAEFDKWRHGRNAEPYWKKFEKGYLDTPKFEAGKKGAEFEHVYNQIRAGESAGGGKYSRPDSHEDLADDLEWSSWLLHSLVHANTKYRDGCFYESQHNEVEVHRLMWHLIKNELRNRSRSRKTGRKVKSPRSSISSIPERNSSRSPSPSSTSGEEPLDPKAGTVIVFWVGVPLQLLTSGQQVIIVLQEFCGYSEQEFEDTIRIQFRLADHNQVMEKMTHPTGLSFREAQRESAQSGSTRFNLMTRAAVIDEETQEAPETEVSPPEQLQGDDDAENDPSLQKQQT